MTDAIQEIPLSKLIPSKANVRRTGRASGIAELAASIQAHGLLQNLTVRKQGRQFEVVAGGRRLAALKALAKKKAIGKDARISCKIMGDGIAEELSLAENALQCAMHPADQYEAFATLHREHGMSADDIAGRFGVTPAVVKQRLKLGAVSPKLINLYREGELNLEQLTAFAITDDRQAQERVWSELSWNKSRDMILQGLTEGQVAADDRRAVFVGAETYEAAGGVIVRDLFDDEGGGFFADAALLNRLVREKLQAKARKLFAEGWKWVSVEPEYDYELTAGMRRIHPTLSAEDQAKLTALEAQLEALEGDDEQAEAEGERLQSEIEALADREQYRPDAIAVAGAVVSLGHDGEPRIERGFIRKEDENRGAAASEDQPEAQDGEEEEGAKGNLSPLSEKLVAELTSRRTSALRHRLAASPETALLAVIHALAAAAFFPHGGKVSCLEIATRSASLWTHAPEVAESPAERESDERHEHWARRMPEQAETLWPFIVALAEAERFALLAHCASRTVNAIRTPGRTMEASVHAHADTLAQGMALDMSRYWQPTAGGYFSRVGKDRILQAVREGLSDEAADSMTGMKKHAMAAAAEEKLAGRGWLPAVLRTPDTPGIGG